MKPFLPAIIVALAFGALGCGGEDDQFPDLDGEWILQGLRCQGELTTRLVSFADRGEGLTGTYLRSDECLDRGGLLWDSNPSEDGDQVDLLTISETDDRSTYQVERFSDHGLRLISVDGGRDLTLRQAAPSQTPQQIGLDGENLAGTWWMDGFLCDEEEIPQLVTVSNPPRLLTVRKVEGDDCVGEDERFFEGSIDEHNLEGDFDPVQSDSVGQDTSIEVTGRILSPDYFYLTVLGHRVVFRRIMADAL